MEDFDYSIKYTETEEIAVKECNKIEKIRARLYSLGLIGAHTNGNCFGSISTRYNKNKSSFVITGINTGEFPKLNPNYYSFVKKFDYERKKMFCIGSSKPSNQWLLHSYLYDLDSQIKAVIIINNERVWDYMINNEFLKIDYSNLENCKAVEDIYKNIDCFLNNSFLIDGNDFSIVAFGKSLSETEKALYNIIKKVLKS
ncbi:hypothetical protein [Halarcobacter ebronensis]|uniref:Class II aldolase/adducin N-terminal domain-containing protein n=1 Tax=Halarcobacter ebronensis TaxID=1462615 RepID=A0A4Q1ANP8_9BACT|nr:hypothetical protein [Halarcobacter ebronensis]QKF82483.1 hypothetical protein AEBR_2004 [Halarcobacter ebronensis]RXK07497.1 hypothetical protein CRV07_03280 [Halarcobacter ebronensis]